MKRKYLLGIILLLLGAGLFSFSKFQSNQKPKKDKRPNIIVILADDLGYSDPGCYGGEVQPPTSITWQKMD